jgi:hypothetical protein
MTISSVIVGITFCNMLCTYASAAEIASAYTFPLPLPLPWVASAAGALVEEAT